MKKTAALLLLLVLGGLATVRVIGVDTALWYSWQLNRQPMPEGALNLGRYRVDIEALPIEGIDDDLSALSYNADRNTLFGVINGTPLIVELSLEGELLRQIYVEDVVDMEGLAHIRGDMYVIAEERSQRLVVLEIADDAERVSAAGARNLQLGIDAEGNKGFEGLTWDHEAERLLVVRERDPLRVLSISGFVDAGSDAPLQLSISDYRQPLPENLPQRDLSSVTLDERTGHLLLLSDESRMVMEYDAQSRPVSVLGLWRGMSGLSRSVPQAEGMTLDWQNRLYLVSEPNLFYRFVPTER